MTTLLACVDSQSPRSWQIKGKDKEKENKTGIIFCSWKHFVFHPERFHRSNQENVDFQAFNRTYCAFVQTRFPIIYGLTLIRNLLFHSMCEFILHLIHYLIFGFTQLSLDLLTVIDICGSIRFRKFLTISWMEPTNSSLINCKEKYLYHY